MARALELNPLPRPPPRPATDCAPPSAVSARSSRGRSPIPTYLEWERGYKWEAHVARQHALDCETWSQLLAAREYREIGGRVARWYARSHLNMLALYEWMALREALEDRVGARLLASGLEDILLHGAGAFGERLEAFTAVLDDGSRTPADAPGQVAGRHADPVRRPAPASPDCETPTS